MKKILIYIILNYSLLFSQTSSLSMYGYGEYINTYDASSISMGDSKYFNGFSNRISFSSPSSYWKSSLSNLMMSIYFNNASFANENLIENNFKIISFSFPLKDNNVIALGMNPLLRTDINIEESEYSFIGSNESPTGNTMAYNSDYSFSGGMSEFFILYSSKISEKLSFGFRWSKIFGNSKHKYFLNLYDVSFDQDENIQYYLNTTESFIDNNRYSSNKYLFELRYSFLKIETVFTYAKSKPLNIEITPYYDTLGYLEPESYYANDKLFERGFGINYNLNDVTGIIFEHHSLNSYNSYDFLNIFNQDSPDIYSNHLGAYFYNGNDMNSNAIFRIGVFNKTYELEQNTLNDSGVTFGFGYNYFNNNNFIDIAFKIGQRSTDYVSFDDEKYYKVVLSLISGEKWFVNERNK